MSPRRPLLAALALAACASAGRPVAPERAPIERSPPENLAAEQPATEQPALDTLAPLLPIAQLLSRGFAAFLAGAELPAAFAPLRVRPHALSATDYHRRQIEDAGIVAADYLQFDFTLIFRADGRDVYVLQTDVFGTATQLGLSLFDGWTPRGNRAGVQGIPLSEFSGTAQPFRAGAEALLAAIAAGDCRRLPLLEPRRLARILDDTGAELQFVTPLEKSRQTFGTVCAELAALRHDEIHLHIGKQKFIGTNSKGEYVGPITGIFEFERGIGVTYLGFLFSPPDQSQRSGP